MRSKRMEMVCSHLFKQIKITTMLGAIHSKKSAAKLAISKGLERDYSVLKDVANVLTTCHSKETSRTITIEKRKLNQVYKVLDHVAGDVRAASQALMPAGGDAKWLAKRNETVNKENDDLPPREWEPKCYRNVMDYNAEVAVIPSQAITPPNVLSTKRRRVTPDHYTDGSRTESRQFEVPVPKNGYHFECMEAMAHLTQMKGMGNKLFIVWTERGYISCSRSKMYSFLNKYKNEKTVRWKNQGGQQALVTDKEFLDECQRLENDKARALEKDEIAEVLFAIKEKQDQENGLWTTIEYEDHASRRSVNRYFSLYADKSGRVVTDKKVQVKTNTRYTAENSYMSAITFLFAAACTMYIIGKDQRPLRHRKLVEQATEGSQKLYQAVKKANVGADVYPVQAGMCLTTDDSTVYTIEGVDPKTGRTNYVLLAPNESYSIRSAYTVDVDGSRNRLFSGQRIRLTFTASGNGRVAPVFATMTGLSESELPKETCPSGILIVKCPGLSIGGSNVMDAEAAVGDIALIRHDALDKEWDSVEKRLYSKYQELVVYPFIEAIRKRDYGFDPLSEEDVPEWLKCVSWTDGALPQIAAILDDDVVSSDKKLNVTRCKHAAAASAVQQMADLMQVFRDIKWSSRNTTADGSYNESLYWVLYDHFRKNDKCNVKASKLKPILDFLACLPSTLTRVRTNMHDCESKMF